MAGNRGNMAGTPYMGIPPGTNTPQVELGPTKPVQTAQAASQAGQAQTPGTVQANNAFSNAAGQLNLGARGVAREATLNPQVYQGSSYIQNYVNPHENAVVQQGIQDLNRAREFTQNQIGDQATAAGAFGGSRHGLLEAENNRNFYDRVGNFSNQVRSQGFNTAVNAGAADASNSLQGQSNRLGAFNSLRGFSGDLFNQARTVNQDLNQIGLRNQAINQAVIDAGRNQFAGYQAQPYQNLQALLSAISGVPVPINTRSERNLVTWDYLGAGAAGARSFYGAGGGGFGG